MILWPLSAANSFLMQKFLRFDFSPGFFIGLGIALLLLPLHWLLAAAGAAAFHELCHLAALKICGGQVTGFHIGVGGAVIRTGPLSAGKALFCTLSGPLGGLLLLLFGRWFPPLAICAFVQSVYNLLPLTGLDGGHALALFLELILPPNTAQRICHVVEQFVLFLLILLCLYCALILHLGLLPILAAGNLVLKGSGGKIPCKSRPMRVQ